MLFRRKNKNYEMNMDMANSTLQNVLTSCRQSPNIIPFQQIVEKQTVTTRIYKRLIIVVSILLLLTFLLPLYILPLCRMTEGYFTPAPVILTNHYTQDDILYLEFSGDHIQFDKAYMVTANDETYYPISFDKQKKCICFPYIEGQKIVFHIPVKNSQEVQLLLTPVYE